MKKKLALFVTLWGLALMFGVWNVAQLFDSTVPAHAAPVVQVAPAVDVNLLIESGQVVEDDTFIVLVTLDPTHIAEISAFQVFLKFDPNVLQLVPESPTNVVEPGAPFGNKRFRDVLTNSFSNTAGEVNFAGGAGVGGLTMIGPFVAVAMTFRAIAPAASTTIDFSTVDPRQTKVLMPGIITVTGTLNGVSFPVGGNTPLSDLFKSGS